MSEDNYVPQTPNFPPSYLTKPFADPGFVTEKAFFVSEPSGEPHIERDERVFDPAFTCPVLLFGWNNHPLLTPDFHGLNQPMKISDFRFQILSGGVGSSRQARDTHQAGDGQRQPIESATTEDEALHGGSSAPPAQNNTRVRSLAGQPVDTELTSIGGLLCGGRHLRSGVTAGETARIFFSHLRALRALRVNRFSSICNLQSAICNE